MRRPGLEETRDHGVRLARELHEPRYWDSDEALNLLSVGAHESSSSVDKVRIMLQGRTPTNLLDEEGKQRREMEHKRTGTSVGGLSVPER